MNKDWQYWLATGLIVTAALLLSGCGASGGKQAEAAPQEAAVAPPSQPISPNYSQQQLNPTVDSFAGKWQSQNPDATVIIVNRLGETRFGVTVNASRGSAGSQLCRAASPCEYGFGGQISTREAGKFTFPWSRNDGTEVWSVFSLLNNDHLLWTSTLTSQGRTEVVNVELVRIGGP